MDSTNSIFNTDVPASAGEKPENQEEKISKQVEEKTEGATHVCYKICFDRSSSMVAMPTAPEALQNFVNLQKEFCVKNNITTEFTITMFDTVAENITGFDKVELKDIDVIPVDEMKPRGYTRLVDTALEQIKEMEEKIFPDSEEDNNEDKDNTGDDDTDKTIWRGIFVILTDGQDNQSRKSSLELKNKIQELTERGVQCYFLGANQNAIRTGNNYGFTEEQSLTYDAAAAMDAMNSASQNITAGLSAGTTAQPGFTQLQREISAGGTVHLYNNPLAREKAASPPSTSTLAPIRPLAPLGLRPTSPVRQAPLTRQLAGGGDQLFLDTVNYTGVESVIQNLIAGGVKTSHTAVEDTQVYTPTSSSDEEGVVPSITPDPESDFNSPCVTPPPREQLTSPPPLVRHNTKKDNFDK